MGNTSVSDKQQARNLQWLTADIKRAERNTAELPIVPSQKSELMNRVSAMQCNLTVDYRRQFWDPAVEYLQNQPDSDFVPISMPFSERLSALQVHYSDSEAEQLAKRYEMPHRVAQIALQHSHNVKWEQTRALQQLSCDLWNTFVNSSGVCPTSHCLPPIVYWGDDGHGPCALHRHKVKEMKVGADAVPIISFPSGYTAGGVAGWTISGHEAAHTLLEMDSTALWRFDYEVYRTLAGYDKSLRKYWSTRISEIGADILGVLYMGPAAAVGLIATLRAARKDGKLSNAFDNREPDQEGDPHPADVLRGLVVAHAVYQLNMERSKREEWRTYLKHEVWKDFNEKRLGLSWEQANDCAKKVASAIVNTQVFQGKSLREIRCWNNTDEAQVDYYMGVSSSMPTSIQNRSPHIVAGACLSLLKSNSLLTNAKNTNRTFNTMIQLLNEEASRQESICITCPLSQRDTYAVCPSTSSKASEEQSHERGNHTLEKTILGIGALALLAFGGYCIYTLTSQQSNQSQGRGLTSRRSVTSGA